MSLHSLEVISDIVKMYLTWLISSSSPHCMKYGLYWLTLQHAKLKQILFFLLTLKNILLMKKVNRADRHREREAERGWASQCVCSNRPDCRCVCVWYNTKLLKYALFGKALMFWYSAPGQYILKMLFYATDSMSLVKMNQSTEATN